MRVKFVEVGWMEWMEWRLAQVYEDYHVFEPRAGDDQRVHQKRQCGERSTRAKRPKNQTSNVIISTRIMTIH